MEYSYASATQTHRSLPQNNRKSCYNFALSCYQKLGIVINGSTGLTHKKVFKSLCSFGITGLCSYWIELRYITVHLTTSKNICWQLFNDRKIDESTVAGIFPPRFFPKLIIYKTYIYIWGSWTKIKRRKRGEERRGGLPLNNAYIGESFIWKLNIWECCI